MSILKDDNIAKVLMVLFLLLAIMSFVAMVANFGPKEFNLTCKISLAIIFLLISGIISAFYRLDYHRWPWQRKKWFYPYGSAEEFDDEINLGLRKG